MLELTDRGLLAQEAWPELQERMIATMVRFQKALLPIVKGLPD
jgi:hypothetical protein